MGLVGEDPTVKMEVKVVLAEPRCQQPEMRPGEGTGASKDLEAGKHQILRSSGARAEMDLGGFPANSHNKVLPAC